MAPMPFFSSESCFELSTSSFICSVASLAESFVRVRKSSEPFVFSKAFTVSFPASASSRRLLAVSFVSSLSLNAPELFFNWFHALVKVRGDKLSVSLLKVSLLTFASS